MLIKILVPSLQTLVQARQRVIAQALQCVLCTVPAEAILTLSGGVLCGIGLVSSLWALLRSAQRSGIPAAAIFVCVVMGKMIAVEYEEEARFFHQRVILRIASIAAMFYTSKEMDDPPNGAFGLSLHTATCFQRCFQSRQQTGLVWLDGRNKLSLTTMMLAGHCLVRVYGFGVQMQIFFPEVIV